MLAERLAQTGNLEGVLAKLQGEVRESPGDARLRTFLFQLLSVMGDWERALKQLQAAGTMDPAAVPMAHSYRELIRCEVVRAEVFAGRAAPTVLGEPREWVLSLVKALELTALGQHEQAESLRQSALEAAPATLGRADAQSFAWIADADSRLGPVLEAIVLGRYCWIPFDLIENLTFEAPKDLRDLVWMPGLITLRGQDAQVVFVPARYPGTEHQDDAHKLSRKTTWEERGQTTFCGLGQRVFATDTGDLSLLDLRQLTLQASDVTADAAHG
ncbi:MAG: type VI secretion system accessory protein TagJ [Myxococcales bacterium]